MTSPANAELPPTDPGREKKPLNVVLFGSYDSSLRPRVAVLGEGLAETSKVTQINSPLGMSTADMIGAATSLTGATSLLLAITRAWINLWRMSRKHRTHADLIVVGYMGHFDVHLARALWPNSRIALDHLVGLADTARDRGLATGLKYRVLGCLDQAALSRADIVIVDTAEQLAELNASIQERAVVVPVGATRNWFEQGPAMPPPPIRVCFVGLYTPLHGAVTIGKAIALLADDDRFQFTMVGSGQDRAVTEIAARASEYVSWIDWLPAEELPALVATQHVCLGIFGTTPKAQRVVPTKVYQGLAAGNLVITSDTRPQRRALGESARFIPAGDEVALASELRRVADQFAASANESWTLADGREDLFAPGKVVAPLCAKRVSMTDTRSLAPGPALSPSAWLRFDLFRAHLEELSRSRILEIGSGRGAVAARLVAAGHSYTGVEFSAQASQATTALLDSVPGGSFTMVSSLSELNACQRFDALCAFEVLEHIENDLSALTDWVSRLEPGGLVLLSVPAWPDRFSAADIEVGHFRRYEPAGLAALAREAGLVEIEVRLYGYPLGDLLDRVRGSIAIRTQKSRRTAPNPTLEERSKGSGTWLQPPSSANSVIRLATYPFRQIQRHFPERGAGLILVATAPLTE